MSNIIPITDLSISELDVYCRLTQAQLKSTQQKEKGLFISEGTMVTEIALRNGIRPISFLVEERHLLGKASAFLHAYPDTPVYTASRDLLSRMIGYEFTRGFLCAMERPAEATMEEVCQTAQKIAVLEDIVDASNLGAIFRNAAAMGLDGILLSPSCCDPLYRKAIRTSMATVFQIPWARIRQAWPAEGLDSLHRMGFTTIALSLRADAVSIESPQFYSCRKAALLLGTEGTGLRPETLDRCCSSAYIPMHAGVDSLNVAAASAIAFWQLCR